MSNDETESTTTKFELPLELVQTIPSCVDTSVLGILPTIERVPARRRVQTSLEGVVGSHVDPTKYRGNGHWQHDTPLGIPGYVGFIYCIRDVMNEKLYLGKKQFRGLGKENKGEDSNWRWYISSSKELSESIRRNGKNHFEFVAIEQYKTKATLSYAETWSLMHVESPFRRDKWYNLLVNKVSWVTKEPITQKHKDRLRMMQIAANAL